MRGRRSVVYPVSAGKDGVKVKPELMEREKMYHTIFGEKVLLIFKDSQDVLNCYEVEERELVEKAKALSGEDVEQLLDEYIQANIHAKDHA